jgi:ubiquitin-protein ligase E3 C
MFDGNHRSRRKVNLGSRRRVAKSARTGTAAAAIQTPSHASDSKAGLLARTQALRHERHAAQQRQAAALCVQAWWRGQGVRRRGLAAWQMLLCQRPAPSSSDPTNDWSESLTRHTRRLNYTVGRTSNVATLTALLQVYHYRLAMSPGNTTPLPHDVWIPHMAQACLRLLQEQPANATSSISTWLLDLWRALPTLVPDVRRCLGGTPGLMVLARAIVALPHVDALWDSLSAAAAVPPALQAVVGWSTGRLTDETSLALVVDLYTHPDTFWATAARGLARPTAILQAAWPQPFCLFLVHYQLTTNAALLAATQWFVLGHTSLARLGVTAMVTVESDSEDEDEDGPSRGSSQATNLVRRSREALTTVAKLNRRSTEARDQARHAAWAGEPDAVATAALAARLADPAVWIAWAKLRLSSSDDDATLYLETLCHILPTSLHTRTTATSPLLTKLAFDASFLPALWRHISSSTSPNLTTLTVLSNVLAQTLMVIKDDEFMATYGSETAAVPAAAVATTLRQALYHVYWVQPVATEQVLQHTTEARFLLAGTKCWNALYQRWCRLVRRTSFATEDIWWFPSISVNTTRVQVGGPSPMDEDDSDDDDAMEISPADAESEALAAAFDDPKMARILTSIPQALPFDKRVKLFDSLVKADKNKTQDEASEMQHVMAAMMRGEELANGGRQRVEIRREHLYNDAMEQLNKLGPKLRRKVQVSFINQHGAAEAGIDGGGVFKEFLDDLVKDAFSPNAEAASSSTASSSLPLFSVTSLETLAVNLDYSNRPDLLSHYEFLGRAIGKAVYEGILVDPQFCLPFLNQLLGKSNSLEDLKNYDPEYYQNLTKLLSLRAHDFASLGLTFEVSIGSKGRTVELQPGSSRQAVTPENVIPYAHLVAHQLLNAQSAAAVRAFLRGFRDLIPAPWVRLFAAHEFQKIVSGDDRGLDVASFKGTMQYAAGYHASQRFIEWFWEIVEKELSSDQQCKLLKFMTSCSRQPLLGFQSLAPAPCIQQIRLPDSMFAREPVEILKRAPLPTSSTCMNLLKVGDKA